MMGLIRKHRMSSARVPWSSGTHGWSTSGKATHAKTAGESEILFHKTEHSSERFSNGACLISAYAMRWWSFLISRMRF